MNQTQPRGRSAGPARNPLKLIDKLLRVAPPVLARFYHPDCCVAAGRIVLDVLARFGVPAEPVTTVVVVWNPAYFRRVAETGQPARSDEELEALWDVDGSYTLGVGTGKGPCTPDGFNGHMVVAAAVPGLGRVCVDPTLTQADRPRQGIRLAPVRFTPGPGWWEGDASEPARARWHNTVLNRCLVMHGRKPMPGGWNAAEDWVNPRFRAVADRIAARL